MAQNLLKGKNMLIVEIQINLSVLRNRVIPSILTKLEQSNYILFWVKVFNIYLNFWRVSREREVHLIVIKSETLYVLIKTTNYSLS